jgi:hypothetical protein
LRAGTYRDGSYVRFGGVVIHPFTTFLLRFQALVILRRPLLAPKDLGEPRDASH